MNPAKIVKGEKYLLIRALDGEATKYDGLRRFIGRPVTITGNVIIGSGGRAYVRICTPEPAREWSVYCNELAEMGRYGFGKWLKEHP